LRDEKCNCELIQAIERSHLKVLSLCSFCGGPLSSANRMAFCQMLRNNGRLEYLYVPCPYNDTAFWDRVRFYVGLNCSGRKHLLQDSKKQCSEEQEEKKDDAATTTAAAPPPFAEDRGNLVRSEIDRCFKIISADISSTIMMKGPLSDLDDNVGSSSYLCCSTKKKYPIGNGTFQRPFSSSFSVKNGTVVTPSQQQQQQQQPSSSSSKRRHEERVHKARRDRKHKLGGFLLHPLLADRHTVIPHEGLASMFITRPASSSSCSSS
jgi:hypothetical protein